MSLSERPRVSTGLSGLDDILGGGLDPDCLYLVEGRPGTGKTTLGLHFLLDGLKRGERGLYITLSESATELRLVAARHGWSLEKVDIFQLVPPEASVGPDQGADPFSSGGDRAERDDEINFRASAPDRTEPRRIRQPFEMRLLAQSSLRYRRQIRALKHFSPAANAPSCSSTISPRMPMTCSFTPSLTA